MNRRNFFKLLGIAPVATLIPKSKEEYEIIPCDIFKVLRGKEHVIHRIRRELIVDVVNVNGRVIYTNNKSQKPKRINEGDKITVDITKVGSHYYGGLNIIKRGNGNEKDST